MSGPVGCIIQKRENTLRMTLTLTLTVSIFIRLIEAFLLRVVNFCWIVMCFVHEVCLVLPCYNEQPFCRSLVCASVALLSISDVNSQSCKPTKLAHFLLVHPVHVTYSSPIISGNQSCNIISFYLYSVRLSLLLSWTRVWLLQHRYLNSKISLYSMAIHL